MFALFLPGDFGASARSPFLLDGSVRLIGLLFLVLAGCGDGSTGPEVDPDACTMPSNPSPVFTHHLTDPSLHSTIHPMGAAWGGYIHDNGHTYLQIRGDHLGSPVPVYAPVDMRVERIIWEEPSTGHRDFSITFRVSCEVWMKLAHITDPVDEIRNLWTGPPASATRGLLFLPESEWLYLSAGDSLGSTTGTMERNNWDFGVYHTDHYNVFINPDRHYHPVGRFEYSGALNSVCPYPFYRSDLREQYEALYGSILTDRPEPGAHCRQGSRDVPGTAAGTWYRVSGDPEFYGQWGGMGYEFGGDVVFGGIGFISGGAGAQRHTVMQTSVWPDHVTEEHCWERWNEWIYLRVNPGEILHAARGEGAECPSSFPAEGFAVYER